MLDYPVHFCVYNCAILQKSLLTAHAWFHTGVQYTVNPHELRLLKWFEESGSLGLIEFT